jgi:hypothetical protein
MTRTEAVVTVRAMPPFHLAFPVHDLAAARDFYGGLLGCLEGRSSDHWVDFDFFGHQIVAHLAPDECDEAQKSDVDGKQVPVRHFGLVLDMQTWARLADRLTGKVEFVIEPYTRFKGEPGEQATMFFRDPSGNAIELKAFADMGQLFAT